MNGDLFTLKNIREIFKDTSANLPFDIRQRNTAVAMIFHQNEAELNLCFGLRAQFEGDPWSGDMAFPGGKGEPIDNSFHDIAKRETFEETGLILSGSNLAGAMDEFQTHGSESRPPLLLRPMIYILEDAPASFQISSELEDAFWIPVPYLWHKKNWVDDYVEWNGRTFPGIQFREHVIWGLTLRILAAFGKKLSCPLSDDW